MNDFTRQEEGAEDVFFLARTKGGTLVAVDLKDRHQTCPDTATEAVDFSVCWPAHNL